MPSQSKNINLFNNSDR